MVKTAVGTGDQPPDPPYNVEAHAEATLNARRRIRRDRRTLTQVDAENIVREEANARAVKVPGHVVRHMARNALRSFWWPFLHPKQARREGYRFQWERDSSEDHLTAERTSASAAIRASSRATYGPPTRP